MFNNWNKFTCYKSTGAKTLSGTFNGAAAVTGSPEGNMLKDWTTTLADTTHGLLGNSDIYISGSVNYDGMRHIDSVGTNAILIRAKYVAETLAGTELWVVGYGNQYQRTIFHGFTLHLSAASVASENLTITIDANDGSAWDDLCYSKDMAGVSDIIWFPDVPHILEPKDVFRFAWANTNVRTWGIRIYVEDIA